MRRTHLLLLAATLTALGLAASPARDAYESFWTFRAGPLALRAWVGDGLLPLFFVGAGLELRREMTERIHVPVVAALAGMAGPALLYVAMTAGHPEVRGWVGSMPTDAVVAVALLAVTRRGGSTRARTLLLSIAVVDDVASVVVMSLAYGRHLPAATLVATLLPAAGIVVAMVTPRRHVALLEDRLAPVVSHVVVPLFVLANLGIPVTAAALRAVVTSRVGRAMLLARLVGKPVGIALGYVLATGRDRVTRRDLYAVCSLAVVGCTVNVYAARLAYGNGPRYDTTVRAVLVASVVAALATAATRRAGAADRRAGTPGGRVTRTAGVLRRRAGTRRGPG